jgi:hypothetical protein
MRIASDRLPAMFRARSGSSGGIETVSILRYGDWIALPAGLRSRSVLRAARGSAHRLIDFFEGARVMKSLAASIGNRP